MKHKFLTTADCKHNSEEGAYGCPVHQGLDICSVCGLAEGELTTDCPGVVSRDKGELIYAGELNFIEGHGWFNPKNPSTPFNPYILQKEE